MRAGSRRTHSASIRAAVSAAALSASLALFLLGSSTDVAGSESQPSARGGAVGMRAANTRSHPELRKTLPITREKRAERRVVMSLKLARLGGLAKGDRLRFTSEFQASTDCHFRSPRCAGRPYDYSPLIESRLYLARERFTKGGKGAVPLTGWSGRRCSQAEHHCIFAHRWKQREIRRLRDLPCAPDRCRINLVVSASSSQAHKGDKVVIGGNQPDGYIAQDRGRISAIRLHGRGRPDLRKMHSGRIRNRRLPFDRSRRVIYAIRVPVRGRDVIAASAKLVMATGTVPYRFRVGAQLITARSATEATSRGYARRGVSESGEVDEMNGFNCEQRRKRCGVLKTGMLTVRDGSRATRRPLFVNLVVETNPKEAGEKSGDRAVVERRSALRVRRYRSAR